jgi:UDP-N-acetylmuramoylalanine--D-glutamate ligase
MTQRALVVGFGASGAAAANLLSKNSYHVTIVDERPRSALPRSARLLAGVKKFPLDKCDLIVTSPGVPWDHRELNRARKKGIPVWGELELGWRYTSAGKTIAITGTNGKTTTTSLIGWILKSARRPVAVGGNIGTPLSALAEKITPETFLVLEVSSYQLEASETFHPAVGVLLNLTPDHLARHKTMANYAKMKARMFRHSTPRDVAVLNKNDAWCRRIARGVNAKKVFFPSPVLKKLASNIRLPGQHNQENAMAAAAALLSVGLSPREIARGLSTFKGVKHRLQWVRALRGVTYINDSKGTNVDSTVVALKACEKPVILILGGEHKGSPYTPLIPLIRKKVKEILTIGEAHGEIVKDLKRAAPIVSCKTMDKAVAHAARTASSGDTVLLSPACASFDQYRNYEHRGDHFIGLVSKLK